MRIVLALYLAGHLYVLPAASGRVSHFGGPEDSGVSETETGAISGERLRELDSQGDYYLAMRWDYVQGPFVEPGSCKQWLHSQRVRLFSDPADRRRPGSRMAVCRVVDWGPSPRTGRAIDTSRAALGWLGLATDEWAWVEWGRPDEEPGCYVLDGDGRTWEKR